MRHLKNVNRSAFLDMIGWSEGTTISPVTKDRGFDVLVTGIDSIGKAVHSTFSDYSKHPFDSGRSAIIVNSKGLASTASGKFQILLRFWRIYQKMLKLPDFGPDSQEQYALQQLLEHGALKVIDAGQFDRAVELVSNIWASFPGKGYVDQHQHPIASLREAYVASGGTFASIITP